MWDRVPTRGGVCRLVALLVVVLTLASASPPTAAAEDSLIARIIEKQKKIKTISADFTQEKHSAMLARPLLSKGKFKFRAPNKVAWTYEGEVQMASDGVYLTVFYPELMEAEVVPVQNSMIRLPLSFNLEEFRKHFTLSASEEDGVYKVVLTPREDSVLFSQMVVRLTRDGVPSSAEILEKIGDRSIIRFSNQKINQELSERDFTINLPKGTVVRRRGSQ